MSYINKQYIKTIMVICTALSIALSNQYNVNVNKRYEEELVCQKHRFSHLLPMVVPRLRHWILHVAGGHWYGWLNVIIWRMKIRWIRTYSISSKTDLCRKTAISKETDLIHVTLPKSCFTVLSSVYWHVLIPQNKISQVSYKVESSRRSLPNYRNTSDATCSFLSPERKCSVNANEKQQHVAAEISNWYVEHLSA